jgi:hypothetical protein
MSDNRSSSRPGDPRGDQGVIHAIAPHLSATACRSGGVFAAACFPYEGFRGAVETRPK